MTTPHARIVRRLRPASTPTRTQSRSFPRARLCASAASSLHLDHGERLAPNSHRSLTSIAVEVPDPETHRSGSVATCSLRNLNPADVTDGGPRASGRCRHGHWRTVPTVLADLETRRRNSVRASNDGCLIHGKCLTG